MMKKFTVIMLAAVLCVAFAIPAMALENEFGGYWRTRVYMNSGFSGNDGETKDVTQTDTRTRLYYTAKLNENLKLVNKFEMNAVFGGKDAATNTSYGDLGADVIAVEVKNTYADFNMGAVNAKVGAQGLVLQRSLVMDNDFSGAIVTYKAGNISVPLIWIKATEGGYGKDANDGDADYYGTEPEIGMGNLTLKPLVLYGTQDSIDYTQYWLGLSVDAKAGPSSLWCSAIYTGGDQSKTVDIAGYLVALGGSMDMGNMDIHGQLLYSSGDDNSTGDEDEGWSGVTQSYYWAEIMGYGVFDEQFSNNSPGDSVSNLTMANIGASMKMNKLTVGADIWYAQLSEDNGGDGDLGTEIDITLSYDLVENLNLTAVGAYLLAGDATTGGVSNDENAFELGTQLSLSF